MPRLLRTGDRIQLKVPTIGGWKGEAVVTQGQCSLNDRMIYFRRDGSPDDGCAMRHEVRLIR
jgi:hypothetical protein